MREIYLKNLNAKIYIDDISVVNEKDFDGKIRVYDSRKEYLDYYEYENFLEFEKETFEQVYEKEISYLENIKTIYELLGTFGMVNVEVISKDQVEMYDCVNYIGEYALLLY